MPLAECFLPLTRPAVNPGLGTGLLLSILLWQQDCFNHSGAGNRIAPVQLGLGTVLARAQACDGVGPAVELPGLRHVVADDEGQATREECVSQLRHAGNLFQNGPQFVRDIPAAVGDMKMLLIRRCSKDVHRKQRVPFLVSRRRLERALNRLCRPVEDGGSAALRPGGLTPEGYCGFVNRANLEQYSNTEEGAEPEGLEVQEVQQQIWPQIEKRLFAMWISSTLSLQLASQVRALHEPPESVSDADRMEKTWCSLRQKLDELDFAAVGGPDELVTSTLVGYLVSQQRCVFSDRPLTDQPSMGHDQVEQILHDELTAVQELSAWEEQPLTPEGFWSPEDLAGQQTQQEMQEDLWNALGDAHRSDVLASASVQRHGAGRVAGLPIVDPPTVLSRNVLIREDHPYYIAAGFLKLFPLGQGDYWAHVQERAENQQPLSFWEWIKHMLLRADGRFQAHPRFYFFALNTALRNKALRSRTYFVKRQVGLNTSASYTNEELMKMGKAQFTKVIAAFEQAMIGSAQEKLQQRSDLEALVEQIEQETLEQKAEQVLEVWRTAVSAEKEALAPDSPVQQALKEQCVAAEHALEAVLGASAVTETASARVFSDRVGDTARVFSDRAVHASARVFSDRVGDAARVFPDRAVTASTRVFSDRVGDAARVLSNRAVDAAAAEDPELRALLEKLQNSLSCLQAGGEIPCHWTLKMLLPAKRPQTPPCTRMQSLTDPKTWSYPMSRRLRSLRASVRVCNQKLRQQHPSRSLLVRLFWPPGSSFPSKPCQWMQILHECFLVPLAWRT